ncbi:MAG TPA: DNA double-strand break repair nuclease NurA [Candidatus Dormibacteraeota bacterium]|nr:DNA double-strand break repair nuclease NurA [Candidatus Dormibacteraeota bacterium]
MTTIHVEDWQGVYGSPYLVLSDDPGAADVRLVEDGERLVRHGSEPVGGRHRSLAFVDGVRRIEAALYRFDEETGRVGRAVAGSHACGAVLADGDSRPGFERERVRRLVICGGDLPFEIPAARGGWAWDSRSIHDDDPDALRAELQVRMRQEEGVLAERLAEEGRLVVVDGPLTYVRSRDQPVIGYVKTHSRALLDPEHHRELPRLRPGERTSLFTLGRDRYSCYLRLVPTGGISGPWAGIVRLEVPQSAGLPAAVRVAEEAAAILPRYAGVAHRDPRAPQNLQPVGALEVRLRHLLGDPGLAYRAVREAVHQLATAG